MTADRFDVAIIALDGMTLHGVAGCHVKRAEATRLKESLRENLVRKFFLAIIPSGSLAKGQRFEKVVKPRTSHRNHGVSTFHRRQADHVCVICESPNLASRIYCEQHLHEQNQRTRKNK